MCHGAATPTKLSYSPLVSQIPKNAVALAAAVVGAIRNVASTTQRIASMCPPLPKFSISPELQQTVKNLKLDARLLTFAAPFAKAAALDTEYVYFRTFEKAAYGFAKMYLFCLFMRVLLSWFSEIDWNVQPFTFLRMITEPYLQIYRGILPPLFGQLDFTPLFGFLILQDVVEVMTPVYTVGLHHTSNSTLWTTTDPLCYFDGH